MSGNRPRQLNVHSVTFPSSERHSVGVLLGRFAFGELGNRAGIERGEVSLRGEGRLEVSELNSRAADSGDRVRLRNAVGDHDRA